MLKGACIRACFVVPADHGVAFIQPLAPTRFFQVNIKLNDGWPEVVDGVVGPDADVMEYCYDGILFFVVVIGVDVAAIVEYTAHMVPVFFVMDAKVGLVGVQDGIDGIGGRHSGLLDVGYCAVKLPCGTAFSDG